MPEFPITFPRDKSFNMAVLFGGDYRPVLLQLDGGKLLLWYQFCLFGVLGVGALLGVTAYYLTRLEWPHRARSSSCLAFGTVTFGLGLLGTPLSWRLGFEPVLTWPVSLFLAYQSVLIVNLWARRTDGRRMLRWAACVAWAVFLAGCVAYAGLCWRMDLLPGWAFLVGFVPAWPIANHAAEVLLSDWGRLRAGFWFVLSFSVYFWNSGLVLLVKSGLGI